jgi:tetratricopeptide (TPR) repeat protein
MKKAKETLIFSLMFLSVFGLGLLSFRFNFRPFLADYFFRKALIERMNNNWPGMLINYQRTLFFMPSESYYRQRLALDLMWAAEDFYKDKENKIKVLEMAIKAIEAIPDSERTFEARAYQAKMLALKANLTQNKEDFEKAEMAYQLVASLSPYMAGVYNDWCQLEIYKKDWQNAFKICEKALSLYPPLNHPDLNDHHRQMIVAEKSQVWQKMASLYLQEKNYSEAEKYLRKILKYYPSRSDVYKYLAEVYYSQKKLDEAIKLNLHAYTLNPKDPALSFGLAILYKEKGDFSQAKFWAEKALTLNPAEKEEIEGFVRGLKK